MRMKNYDLQWAREWAGLTQAEAANKMGVHRVTFANWETGARPMPKRKWNLFLKTVAVNPQDIPTHTEPEDRSTRNPKPTFRALDVDWDDEPDAQFTDALHRSWFEPPPHPKAESVQRLYAATLLSWQRDPKGMADAFRVSALRFPYPGESASDVEAKIRDLEARAKEMEPVQMTVEAAACHEAECAEEQRRTRAGMPYREYYKVHPLQRADIAQAMYRLYPDYEPPLLKKSLQDTT